MPQHETARSKAGPPTAEEVEQRLFGLGPLDLQLDGCRLTAPSPLRERLGALCHEPFVFSIYNTSHLRIIPKILWPPYQNFLFNNLEDPVKARDLISRLNTTCKTESLDKHHRWDVPAHLVKHSEFKDESAVVLFPCRFWLELTPLKTWEEFTAQTVQCIREAASFPWYFNI